jgi:hypothetical protein
MAESAAPMRLEKFWGLPTEIGVERPSAHVYLGEIVAERYALCSGLQLIRDELQFAGHGINRFGALPLNIKSCGADFSLPSVVTTLAHTNCGDRIHQDEMSHYQAIVANRFATMSESGTPKVEGENTVVCCLRSGSHAW